MLLHRLDEHLDARELDPAQALGELQVDLGREASGAPVRDTAGSVHGAEVAARGDVARAQVEFDAERLQHAPPDLIVERIVAEEPEMAGPLPGVIPGATWRISPQAASVASWDRFGSCAVSSSERPVSGRGSPPRPSSETRTIFVVF